MGPNIDTLAAIDSHVGEVASQRPREMRAAQVPVARAKACDGWFSGGGTGTVVGPQFLKLPGPRFGRIGPIGPIGEFLVVIAGVHREYQGPLFEISLATDTPGLFLDSLESRHPEIPVETNIPIISR